MQISRIELTIATRAEVFRTLDNFSSPEAVILFIKMAFRGSSSWKLMQRLQLEILAEKKMAGTISKYLS